MINKVLINLGLLTLPFISVMGYDSRKPKMILMIAFAVALSLLGLYNGCLKKIKNKWIPIFIGYLYLSFFFSPKPKIVLFNINVSNFWIWEPIAIITVLVIMGIAISSIKLKKHDIEVMFSCISWATMIMAGYCIFQYFGYDQFFARNTENCTMGRVGGFMGHPVVVGTWMAMVLPLIIYSKKYLFSIIVLLGIIATQSQTAIGAVVVSLAFYFTIRHRKTFLITVGLLLAVAIHLLTSWSYSPETKKILEGNGRFQEWATIWEDCTNPVSEDSTKRTLFTGYGIGSFYHVYHIKHNSPYYMAHNEYLSVLFDTGFIGLFIFLAFLFNVFKDAFVYGKSKYRMALLAAFISICISAGAMFVWQLGCHIYYSVFLVALIYNKTGGENEEVDNNCNCKPSLS